MDLLSTRLKAVFLFLFSVAGIATAGAQVAPTLQAANLNTYNLTNTSTSISWNNGNGSSRVVFIAAASTGIPAPSNNFTYIANAAFGTAGTQLGVQAGIAYTTVLQVL